MTRNLFKILPLFLLLLSCENQNEKTQVADSSHTISADESKNSTSSKKYDIHNSSKLELVNLGVTIDDFKSMYSQFDIINEPLYEYGIDSEDSGYTVVKGDKKILFVWTMQGSNLITGIEVLSDDFTMKDGVQVGMSVEDFKKLYPSLKVYIDQLDYDSELIMVEGLNYHPIIKTSDSTRIALYENPQSSSYSTDIIRPHKKIDVITIRK